jgi:hypothetical protein
MSATAVEKRLTRKEPAEFVDLGFDGRRHALRVEVEQDEGRLPGAYIIVSPVRAAKPGREQSGASLAVK